jgi:hypothetical protein
MAVGRTWVLENKVFRPGPVLAENASAACFATSPLNDNEYFLLGGGGSKVQHFKNGHWQLYAEFGKSKFSMARKSSIKGCVCLLFNISLLQLSLIVIWLVILLMKKKLLWLEELTFARIEIWLEKVTKCTFLMSRAKL